MVPMSFDDLLIAIDGAHYVFNRPDKLYVWHGGTIVNIYNLDDKDDLDCFTFKEGRAYTVRQIHTLIMVLEWEA